MLFNTISGDIITNTNQYFDKQSEDRYREALPRIFDLALKIDNVNNILNRELKDSLQKKINKELQKGEIIANKASFFDIENKQIYKESLNLGIKLSPESKLDQIDYTQIFSSENSKEYINFSKKIMELYSTKIKIKRLQRLKSDYDQYKKNLANNLDNLLPIDLIYSDESIIKSSEFSPIIDTLSIELKNIKSKLSNKQPLEIETHEHLKKLNTIEKKLQDEIDNFPLEIKKLESFNQLITSIGKVNAKKELFTNINNTDTYNQNLINSLQNELNSIDILNIDSERELVLSLINEIGNKTLKLVSDSLDNYGTWNFYFNYKDKITQLRKPSSVTENVGSSSNHMFLHLLHFLTLHHVILLRQSPYIPSFLLIDQLSRPYYGTDNTNKNNLIDKDSDKVRVHSALNLLNQYINDLKSINYEFQMILIEHIPKEYIESFENFHIVEKFDSENPLIPKCWY